MAAAFTFAQAPKKPQAAPKEESSQSAAPRRYVNLPKPVQAPFSDGVLVGNTLYIAGRLGLDPKTSKLPDDVEQEARIVLDGVKSVLAEAGMTMDDLVFVQVFCPDVSLYGKFNEIPKPISAKTFQRARLSVPGRWCAALILKLTGLRSRDNPGRRQVHQMLWPPTIGGLVHRIPPGTVPHLEPESREQYSRA